MQAVRQAAVAQNFRRLSFQLFSLQQAEYWRIVGTSNPNYKSTYDLLRGLRPYKPPESLSPPSRL